MNNVVFRPTIRIFSTVVLFTLLAGIASPSVAQPAADTLSEKVDAYITETMHRFPIPGLVVGIVKGDEVLYLHGYGAANTNGDPVTPQTPFMLGSVTKTFTSLATRQLVNAGKIKFGEPVQTYIPEFRLADQHASETITVGQLFDHKSGISTNEGQAPYIDSPQTTSAEAIRKLARFQPKYEAGEHYEYSNWNYILLAEVISRASGQPYTEYVQKNILQPLEMSHASFADYHTLPASATGNLITFGVSVPYDEKYIPIYVGAGYLTASAEEMTHYLIAYLNSGQYDDQSLLPAVGEGWYDLSWNWQVGRSKDAYDGFSGGLNSIQTNLTLFHNVGVVVLMNTRLEQLSSAAPGVWDIALNIAHIATDSPYELLSNRGFYTSWILIDSFLLVMIAGVIWQAINFNKWRKYYQIANRSKRIIAWIGILLDLAVCIAVLVFPYLAHSSWSILVHYRPDFAIPLLVAGLCLGSLGIIKVVKRKI